MTLNQTASPGMQPLAWEKVSVQDARKSLEDHRPAYQKNWARQRLPEAPVVLLNTTRTWLLGLPADVRPLQLAKRFPRIANNLAKLWKRPAQCEHALAELLIVRRGDTVRQGFPAPIAREIAALSAYYSALHPAAARAGERALEWS